MIDKNALKGKCYNNMLRRLFKGLCALFFIVVCTAFILASSPVINVFALEEEPLFVNGAKVTHLNSSTQVTIPKTYVQPEAEMRGVWVATVFNIDVAKQNGTSPSAIKAYQTNFLSILDRMGMYNMNTIFFQIRPSNDAFYQSDLNPWSEFLVSHGTDPGWDPLAWMVEETHKRGMQFQCWLNAYRITPSGILPSGEKASQYTNDQLISMKHQRLQSLNDKSFAKQNPEYVILGESDTKLILNPGEPEVHDFLVDTIMEIVTKYDVDGLHFDDYFYLSGSGTNSQTQNRNFAGGNTVWHNENTLNDLGTYARYQANPSAFGISAGLTLGDFRRASINNMMTKIRQAIDNYNQVNQKFVEFGSKPAAVWRSSNEFCGNNERNVAGGSNTHCYAYSSYFDLFADSRKWVEDGLVDYIAPQVYFDFANREVPYADIVSWWADIVTQTNIKRANLGQKPVKMYVAHGIYHFDESDTRFMDPKEMVYQLKFNQKYDCIKGSAVFAYNDLLANTTPLQKQGMAYFKTVWNKPVLPLSRGEYDASNLTVGDYQIVKKASIDEYKIIIPKNDKVSYYALYRTDINKNSENLSVDERIGLYRATEGPVVISLNETTNHNYYLKPVSVNFHVSNQAEALDLSKAQVNTVPELGEIVFNDGETLAPNLTDVIIKFAKAIDQEDEVINYQIYVSITGPNGNFNYEVAEYDIIDGYVYAYWYSFAFNIEEACVKVIASDGELETSAISNVIRVGKASSGENPDPNPNPNPQPKPKGCQTSSMWYLYAMLLGAVILPLLRKRK